MGSSKYTSKTLAERIELAVREEMNKSLDIPTFIENLSRRLTEVMEDEIRFRRYK